MRTLQLCVSRARIVVVGGVLIPLVFFAISCGSADSVNSGSSGVLGSLGGSAAPAVPLEWVIVVDAGNAPFTIPGLGSFGSVAQEYLISKYETTNAQYAEFLNAVAGADRYELYNTGMGSGFGGIARSGSAGSYTYDAIAGRENKPVNFVSFYDALRFSNWLHNGQPTGGQGNATTEDGAYTLLHDTGPSPCVLPPPRTIAALGEPSNWCTISRKAGATVFLPDEDEWFKAAYYNPAAPGGFKYFFQPTGTHAFLPQSSCTEPGPTANTYNCNNAVGDLTDVGSYTGSASPNDTFDQGGNVFEWNELIIDELFRAVRGGDFEDLFSPPYSRANSRPIDLDPASEGSDVGFRLASTIP